MNLLKEYALTDGDINSLVKTNIIDYKQLYEINNLKDVMKNGSVVILYETSPNKGHWVCLKESNDRKTIYFLDSYGLLIDDEFKFIPKKMLGQYYQDGHTRLRKLIYDSDYKNIEYNEKHLQSDDKGVNTCGRYCVAFLKFDATLDEFVEFLVSMKGNTPDDLVLKITNYLFLNR